MPSGVPGGRARCSFQRLRCGVFAKGERDGTSLLGGCAACAMAHVLRLTLAALIALFSFSAHALVPKGVQSYSVVDTRGSSYGTNTGATPAEACTKSLPMMAGFVAGGWKNIRMSAISATQCRAYGQPGANPETDIGTYPILAGAPSCPANSTASGSSCACTSPYVEDASHTSCVPPPTSAQKWKSWCQAAIGQSLGPLTVPGHSAPGGCLSGIDLAGSPIETPGYSPGDVPAGGGCSFDLGTSISYKDDAGAYQTQGTGAVNGGTCVQGNAPIPNDAPPDTTQAPPASPDPCPSGYPGVVNGSTVCASRDPTSGIEGVKGTDTKNADGTSTSTKETTKCNAGMCTTTKETTTKDAEHRRQVQHRPGEQGLF
jgi:hypothetical protein